MRSISQCLKRARGNSQRPLVGGSCRVSEPPSSCLPRRTRLEPTKSCQAGTVGQDSGVWYLHSCSGKGCRFLVQAELGPPMPSLTETLGSDFSSYALLTPQIGALAPVRSLIALCLLLSVPCDSFSSSSLRAAVSSALPPPPHPPTPAPAPHALA